MVVKAKCEHGGFRHHACKRPHIQGCSSGWVKAGKCIGLLLEGAPESVTRADTGTARGHDHRPVPWHGMQKEELSLVAVLEITTICAKEQTHSDIS